MEGKVLVKIYGEKDWTELMFGTRPISEFEKAIDIANITRLRCRVRLVDGENNVLRKWNNL